jgi:hypothetical protein
MVSPYEGLPSDKWLAVTKRLAEEHPLKTAEIAEVVLTAWNSIFESKIGRNFFIGQNIFPKPQIMGFFLHELIPLELAARHPNVWRGEKISEEKDIVHIPNKQYSIEVKTSSDPRHIFGNRSYAQEATKSKKIKSGYYLAVNFEKFLNDTRKRPNILLVRFGWIDATDWIGQKAATGQQARLNPDVEKFKLLELYRNQ